MIDIPSRARKLALLGGVGCTVLGGVVLWKETVSGRKLETIKSSKEIQENIEKKVFVVTGANSGIGLQTVSELARRKGKVYMACRDLTKCEEERTKIVLETRNKYVYCRKCDLASRDSIREFVRQFRSQETQCDVLINNAGVMKSRRMLTVDGIENQLGVNHMGHYLLTELLKPCLAQAGGGRVLYLMNLDYRKGEINFEDLNSEKEYDPDTAFYQSQLANMLTVTRLAKHWKDDNISVNAVYPGVCSTNIKRHMGIDKSISANIIAKPFLWFMTKSPERGSQSVIWAATEPSIAGVSGKLFSRMQEEQVEDKALDVRVAEQVLAVTRFWTELENKEKIQQELHENINR